MKTYPLNNSDKSTLIDFKKAFESHIEAIKSEETWRVNNSHNWLLNREFEVGTALRKSGFDVTDVDKRWDREVVYAHICELNL